MALLLPCLSQATESYSYKRNYIEGENLSYMLTASELDDNNQAKSTVRGFSEHHVSSDASHHLESIQWVNMIKNCENVVLENKPETNMSLSLDGGAKTLSFDGEIALIGLKTDLATFYEALTIDDAAQKVQSPAETYRAKKLVRANIRNKETDTDGLPQLLQYESCLSLSIEMTDLTNAHASYKTLFSEPSEDCALKLFFDWMKDDEFAVNFQHLTKVEGGYYVMWGQEKFETRISVNRESGKIVSGEFGENYLQGRGRFCQDPWKEACEDIIPITLKRAVQLDLRIVPPIAPEQICAGADLN
jgi:hypothetical protein